VHRHLGPAHALDQRPHGRSRLDLLRGSRPRGTNSALSADWLGFRAPSGGSGGPAVACPAMCAADRLRVAYLCYRGKPPVGGQGVYTRHLTKALVDLGHTVEVFGGQPYPVLDERVALTKLPSLDIFNDYYPGRTPAYWEMKHWEDWLELAQFSTGT